MGAMTTIAGRGELRPDPAATRSPSGVLARRPTTTRRAVARLVLSSLVVAVALGVVGAVASRRAAEREAIRNASVLTEVLAASVVSPNLSDSLLRGDPAAISRLDSVVVGTLVNGTLVDGPLVRVKIWTPDGRIVYSDEHRLIGARFPLAPDEIQALHHSAAEADVSDLSAPENQFERGEERLLEVYLPIWTPNHSTLLLETYSRYSSVTASAAETWRQFVPITVGALLLLQLFQIPIAWSTTRRLDNSLRDRERLLHRAVEAKDAERQRIARDLHDGVVQDLAAASYSLVGASTRAASAGHDDEATALERGAEALRYGIRSLRTLLVELYPPSLRQTGLAAALRDLLDPLAGHGIEVDARIAEDVQIGGETAELVFRVAQEAVRNVVAHSGATTVTLRLDRDGDTVTLTVADDGVGFDAARLDGIQAGGHVGLLLLRDLARTAGATLDLESAPGDGTRLRLEVSDA